MLDDDNDDDTCNWYCEHCGETYPAGDLHMCPDDLSEPMPNEDGK